MNKQNFALQQRKLEKSLKFVKKTLELLLAHAITEKDFKVLEYSINDYLKQGYHVEDFAIKYNTKYKNWRKING